MRLFIMFMALVLSGAVGCYLDMRHEWGDPGLWAFYVTPLAIGMGLLL
jgi:hypothetical protein